MSQLPVRYSLNQQQNPLRLQTRTSTSRDSSRSRQFTPQTRRSRFESLPIIRRSTSTTHRSSLSGLRDNPDIPGISRGRNNGRQTRYPPQATRDTVRAGQQPVRAVSRTLYNSLPSRYQSSVNHGHGQRQAVTTQFAQQQPVVSASTSVSNERHKVESPILQSNAQLAQQRTVDTAGQRTREETQTNFIQAAPSITPQHTDVQLFSVSDGRLAQNPRAGRVTVTQPQVAPAPVHHGSFIHGPHLAAAHEPATHRHVIQPVQPKQSTISQSPPQQTLGLVQQPQEQPNQHTLSIVQKYPELQSAGNTIGLLGQQPNVQTVGLIQPIILPPGQSVTQPQHAQGQTQAVIQQNLPSPQPSSTLSLSRFQPQPPQAALQSSLPVLQPPQSPQAALQSSLPVLQQPQSPQAALQSSLPVLQQPQSPQAALQSSLPVLQQPQSQINSIAAAQPLVANSNLGVTGHEVNSFPAQTQPQAAADINPTLHADLVAAFVAALEGRLSPQPAAPVVTPVHTQNQGFMQPTWGSSMYPAHSSYGHFQQMYPAHMYPAYMQEMLFGDTQDPPDPTQPTPNVTTAIPDVMTPSVSEPVTQADVFVTSKTSSEALVTDMTTFLSVDTVTPESSTIGVFLDSSTAAPMEALLVDAIPVTTEIPLPSEQKSKRPINSRVLSADTSSTQSTEKLKTMFKAAQTLRGKLTETTRQKLLTGIRDIIQKSNVDLASLKATLNTQVAALKASVKNHMETTPTVTDSPHPSRDTTLAVPTVSLLKPHHTKTATIEVGQKIKVSPAPAVKQVVEVRSLIDTGTSPDAVLLQSILKEIAIQSKGKNALPIDLNTVNFKVIADSLVPKGTDLATQLADPNFIKLLREIVSKLHSFAHATPVTKQFPEVTTQTQYFTTTGEYEI